jgi:hypothetical protein
MRRAANARSVARATGQRSSTMSTPYDAIPQQVADERIDRFATSAAVGWTDFAALMMGIAGAWNILQGILAVADSNVFDDDARFVFSNLSTWGWISIVAGALLLFASWGVLRGMAAGRWIGIAVVSLNAIGQLAQVSYQPFWGVTMFAVDVFILYALVVYGNKPIAN